MAVITSHDGHVVVNFEVKNIGNEVGCAVYTINYKGTTVVQESRLSLALAGAPGLHDNLTLVDVAYAEHDEPWIPLYGERGNIPNQYREMTAYLQETIPPHRLLQIAFRAYNEGAALRYIIPKQNGMEEITLEREITEFRFPAGCYAYEEHGTEGEYFRKPVEEIAPHCERPLTVEYPDGKVACLVEAASFDYPRMLLSRSANQASVLLTDLDGPVHAELPFSSPWRGFVVGDQPGDLLERNYLVLNLVPPCQLQDTDWIKPGKAIREVTLSTKGAKACVDFAAAHGLQYIEFDAGWYGPETSELSDATKVNIDPARKQPAWGDLDLAEVVQYAKERGIGVFLYVNRRALEQQLDELFPLYEQWGIAGVKFGFVQVGSQKWTQWLMDAVRKAAAHHLMVDIHDEYRPSGFTRPYPNLLTQEGVRGNEHMPTARHNTTLPFTRYIAGAADCTICYYTDRIKTTHAHQLAMTVVTYSPLQFMYWYDKPSAYQGEPEGQFIADVPTVWDDTKVVHGAIGEYATIVRRKGDEWFVGSITNEEPRTLAIPLDFLEKGQRYLATVYSDTEVTADNRTGVKEEKHEVDSTTVVSATLFASGGQAIHLVPTGKTSNSK